MWSIQSFKGNAKSFFYCLKLLAIRHVLFIELSTIGNLKDALYLITEITKGLVIRNMCSIIATVFIQKDEHSL